MEANLEHEMEYRLMWRDGNAGPKPLGARFGAICYTYEGLGGGMMHPKP